MKIIYLINSNRKTGNLQVSKNINIYIVLEPPMDGRTRYCYYYMIHIFNLYKHAIKHFNKVYHFTCSKLLFICRMQLNKKQMMEI